MQHAISFLFGIGWLAGLVLAKGFWSTLVACVVPLWAWYLVVEQALKLMGVPA